MFVVRLVIGMVLCVWPAGLGSAAAQALATGKAVDRAGTPLEGVELRTSSERVVTGRDGTFLLTDESSVNELVADGYDIAETRPATSAGVELVLVRRPARVKEHVVVTAHRREADPLHVPGSVTVVTRRQLETRLPRTTPGALMEAAGVFVQQTNHGGGSPYLRGLVGNQVLVLVDGVRLNTPPIASVPTST